MSALALIAAGVALSAGGDVADLPVRLSSLRAVTVVSADGSVRSVDDGDTLRRGDTVRTGPDGSAVMTVERRRVVLAEESEVVVPDGASLDVRRGSVLLDRRRGPGLTVVAGDVRLDRIDPGAVRVDRSYVVQVSVYAGRTRVRTSTGRQLTLTSLRTVGVAGRTLPTAGRPLSLSTPPHPWERDVLPGVVAADAALTRLAAGRIDATLKTAARARSYVAAFADVLSDVTADAPASEAVLPVAIGRAARDDRAERARVASARDLRADGGSWGVVAAIADARSGDVASRLEALLAGAEVGADGGTGPTSGPGPDGGGGAGPGDGTGQPSPAASGGRPSRSPAPPSGSPSPTPSPSASPNAVEELVEDVEELVPTPSLPPLPELPVVDLGLSDLPVL